MRDVGNWVLEFFSLIVELTLLKPIYVIPKFLLLYLLKKSTN